MILASIDFSALFEQFLSREMLLLVGLISVMGVITLVFPKKGKITTGRAATFFDKYQAALKGEAQLKKQKANQICFYCGTPSYFQIGPFRLPVVIQALLGGNPTLYLPDSERSALVVGTPGSGKTASILDPVTKSAITQNKSILLFDKKGDQTKVWLSYAATKKYRARVFSPGKPYTCCINPLDFMKDEFDATMAREIANVLNSNAKGSEAGKGDEFFTKAGEQVIQGVLQLAKSVESKEKYGDLYQGCGDFVMAYALLQLPNLVSRLDYAVKQGQIDRFIASSFTQLLSVKEAEKTVSGILGNASGIFSNLIQMDLLPSFLGKSTAPLYLGEKMMIAFELDENRRSAVGPLLASVMHMVIVLNASKNRDTSLLVMLDEFPSLVFRGMENKINEHRSRGISYYLGIQSLEQIYNTYGEKNGDSIINAAATKAIFNTGGSVTTAERFAKSFGEVEMQIKSNSRSYSRSGGTRSTSDSLQRKQLATVDEFNRLPPGSCYLVNPAYGSKKEGSYPFKTKVFIPKSDWTEKSKMEKLWEDKIESRLQKLELKSRPDSSKETLLYELERRMAIAEQILPAPPDEEEGKQSNSQSFFVKGKAPDLAKIAASSGGDNDEEDDPIPFD